MKEQILHLDSHDDGLSARDKMGWVQTQRVLLVWPPRGRVLTRRLDLVLLHRHATALGAMLGLVTQDSDVRDHAAELGLPCFDSLPASRRPWRYRKPRPLPATPRRQPPPDPDPLPLPLPPFLHPPAPASGAGVRAVARVGGRLLRPVAFSLALAAVAVAALIALPGAAVQVSPLTRPINLTLPLTAAVDPGQAADLPAREVAVELESSLRIPTTGLTDVPSTRASGSVTFTSLINQPVSVPAGTGVRTTSGGQARFLTTQPAQAPAGPGQTVQVPIQAAEPGPQGNVAAEQINAVEGPLGLQLAVINPQPTSGGGVEQRSAVSPDDQARVRAQLLAEMQQSAIASLAGQLGPYDMLPAQSVTVTRILAETYDRFPGEQSDTLALTLRVRVTGLAVDESLARDLAFEKLAALGRSQFGQTFALAPGSQSYTRLSDPQVDPAGLVTFRVSAGARVARQINPGQVRLALRGLTPAEAAGRLAATQPISRAPQIEIWPAWYPRLPLLPFRIRVLIAES